jgi:L-2-hydroxyglutarate oxidase LhgO
MDTDILIVGAGVVGLACAATLSASGHTVLVVERHAAPGLETSSRNSEVIHAGLYYPPGSLKATCCVEGRQDLYKRCRIYQIPHRKLGKFVVASEPQECAALESIRSCAAANDAGAVRWVEADELARSEPRVRGHAALWSPESGIVDAHALLQSYQAELESSGGQIVFRTVLVELEHGAGAWNAVVREASGELASIRAGAVVNAAGLEADGVAALAGIDIAAAGYRQRPCKGDYFAVAPRLGAITRHLVYPVPSAGGLGIHVTVDLGGRYRLGPDVEYVDAPRYDVDPDKADAFATAVRRYLPEITAHDLSPDFAGIRPKLQGPGEPFRDYLIEEAAGRGAPRLINLIGIESPGLTAASAIARRVEGLLASC